MKKYLLIVKRNMIASDGIGRKSYFARKTVYAKNKTEAAKEFSRMLKQKVPVKLVIDMSKLTEESQGEENGNK